MVFLPLRTRLSSSAVMLNVSNNRTTISCCSIFSEYSCIWPKNAGLTAWTQYLRCCGDVIILYEAENSSVLLQPGDWGQPEVASNPSPSDIVRLSSRHRTTKKQCNSNNCSLKREYSGMCQWTKALGHIKLNQNERVVLQCLKFWGTFHVLSQHGNRDEFVNYAAFLSRYPVIRVSWNRWCSILHGTVFASRFGFSGFFS